MQHFNLDVQQQIGAQPRRRGRLRRLARQQPADLHGGQSRRSTRPGRPRRARASIPAFALVRPTFSVARVVVRLAAGQPADAADRTASTSSRRTPTATPIDHVSGLNIGGEPRPVLPVTIGDEARSTRRWRTRRATRCSTCATASSSASAQSCRRRGHRRGRASTSLGGWQVNGIVQAQTGFPPAVYEPTHGHPLPDQPARRHLRSRTTSAAHRRPVVQHQRASRAARWRDTGTRPGNAGRNTVRGPGFARTDLSLFKNIDLAAPATGSSCASRRSTCSTRRASASPASRSARRTSAGSRRPRTAGSSSSAAKYCF